MNTSYNDLIYKPEWERYHLEKEAYTNLLQELASKEKGATLILSDQTLRVATFVEAIWNKIVGWLGFEDRTDPIKVNYELLKILRFGESHHFFDDQAIRKTLAAIQQNLVHDYSYARIAQVINGILNAAANQEVPYTLINTRIKVFYNENKGQLQEALWPGLFHRYIAPVQHDAALVQFNMGRIFLAENDFEKAVISFQNALEMDPDYPDCLAQLSKALLGQGEQLINQQLWMDAHSIYDKTLLTLKMVNFRKLNQSEANEVNELFVKVYIYKFAVELKMDNVNDAIATLQNVSAASATPIDYYLKQYFNLIQPSNPLFVNEFQISRFFVNVANHLPDFKTAFPYLHKAAEILTKISQIPNRHPDVYANLIQAHAVMGKGCILEKQYDSSDGHYCNAFDVFIKEQNHLTDEMKAYFFSELYNGYTLLAAFMSQDHNYAGAIRVYRRLKAMFPMDNITTARCSSEVSKLLAIEGDYREAFNEIQQACFLDPKEEYTKQFKEVTVKLAQKCFSEGLYGNAESYWNQILAIDSENLEAFQGLALVYIELGQDDKADFYLKKALSGNPNDMRLTFLQGRMQDRQGNFAAALESYHQAYKLDPQNPTFKQQLYLASIEAGDRIYAKGSCSAEHVQQSVVEFVDFVRASPAFKKIEMALGAWRGTRSTENREFAQLGKGITNPDDILEQGKRAIELIEKAYDGRSSHLSPTDIPSEINARIQVLNQQLSQMIAYYSMLREAVATFVNEVVEEDYYPDIVKSLGSWLGSISSENKDFRQLGLDFTKLSRVEKDFKKALKLIEKAYDGKENHLSPHQMPQDLRDRIGSMRQLLTPTSSAHEAIPHYLKAIELAPDQYHDYLNRFIDSYLRINDAKRAVEWYEKLVQKFPNHPIWLDPEAYLKNSEQLLASNKFVDALAQIKKALELAPNRISFKKALSHAYFLIGEGFLKKQNDVAKAFEYYQKAISCEVDADAACYAAIADHYERQVPATNSAALKNSLIGQILQYRKKAIQMDPQNPEFLYQYGRVLYHEDLQHREDPIPYLEKAVELQPNNLYYLYGLIMAKRKRGDSGSKFDSLLNRFKALGGNFATDYWHPLS